MAGSNILVTKENCKIGLKVIRGKDWDYGDQDRDSRFGTIMEYDTSYGWTRVKWESGYTDSYRIGAYGYYDLYFYKIDHLSEEEQLNILIENL